MEDKDLVEVENVLRGGNEEKKQIPALNISYQNEKTFSADLQMR